MASFPATLTGLPLPPLPPPPCPPETTSPPPLTPALFRRQVADPALTRPQALQQTMNALIDSGGYMDPQTKHMVFSYAHPIFWAPFTLVGDGGR